MADQHDERQHTSDSLNINSLTILLLNTCYFYRVSKNVLYRVSEKYQKYQINNKPYYKTCNRMFDMCSSYSEKFIYFFYPLRCDMVSLKIDE